MKQQYLTLRGISAPVRLSGMGSAAALLAGYFRKWPYRIAESSDKASFATLTLMDGRHTIETAFSDEPRHHRTAVNAICDLVAAAARQRTVERQAEMCLHAAAVQFAGSLVVFPATRRAGKSVLTAACCARGHSVFGDDVLPVSAAPGQIIQGIAIGAPVRLRRPVLASAPDWFVRFADAHAGPGNAQYLYLDAAGVAENGQRAPIGALVLPDRRPGEPARTEPIAPDEMLKVLLHQNFARQADADHILRTLFALAEGLPAFRLVYDDLTEAVGLLEDRFAEASLPGVMAPEPSAHPSAPPETVPDDPILPLVQCPGAMIRELGGQAFATNRHLTRIMALDPMARGVWDMLSEPVSEADAASIIAAAFPQTDTATIRRDTKALFDGLRRAGLVVGASGPAEPSSGNARP